MMKNWDPMIRSFVLSLCPSRAVRMTQKAIKQVLTERYYSWQEAELLAQEDPEIDLSGEGPVYNPMEFEEEVDAEVKPEISLDTGAKTEQKTSPIA